MDADILKTLIEDHKKACDDKFASMAEINGSIVKLVNKVIERSHVESVVYRAFLQSFEDAFLAFVEVRADKKAAEDLRKAIMEKAYLLSQDIAQKEGLPLTDNINEQINDLLANTKIERPK